MWLRSVTRRGLLGLATAAVLGAQTALADVSHYSNMDDFAALADSLGGFPSQTFRSSSIIAPVFQVNTWRADRIYDASHILLGTIYGEWRAGPMILSAKDLSLVYADQHYDNSYWASVEQRKGESFLTFWQGGRSRFHSNGYCRIYDKHYNLRWQVTAQGLEPSLADMHEMAFTPEGNVIFSVYFNIDYDCTPVGGPANGVLMDAGFQEVNPETNEVVFEWRASEHFGITDSFGTYDDEFGAGPGDGFDFFHINSVEKVRFDAQPLPGPCHLAPCHVLPLSPSLCLSPSPLPPVVCHMTPGRPVSPRWLHQLTPVTSSLPPRPRPKPATISSPPATAASSPSSMDEMAM